MSLETRLAALVNAVGGQVKARALASRLISAGTGLSGGGDLSADRTLAVLYGTAASTAAEGNDSRIVNAVPNTRTISAGTGLSGGGSLAANRSLAVVYGTGANTAAEGDDSRILYTAPVGLSLNSSKFANFGAPFQSLRVWRQGRTAFLTGFIKNTVDLGLGGHIIVASGGIPSGLRPTSTVPSVSNPGDRLPRIDVTSAGVVEAAVGLYTVGANAGWPVNMNWSLD